jgi:GntR family transcriptional regulator, N-acetylglucosamine utilization regulator
MSILQRQNAIPLYLQIKRLLEREIANGSLAPHSRVPSERELSEQHGISRMTARQALAELIQEGRLYTSAGKGTFVAEPKINQSIQSLTSFSEEMRSRGVTPTTRVLRRAIAPASTVVAERLQIPKQAPVVCLERLRLGNAEPMAIEIAFLAFEGMEKLITLDLEDSLYTLLRNEFNIIPATAIQECEAALARPHERSLLCLRRGAPVLKIQRTTFDSEQRPFEYVQSAYRGDRYRFVARLVRDASGIE